MLLLPIAERKPYILYYVLIRKNRRTYYKIGTTKHSIAKRFIGEKVKPKIVCKMRFESLSDCQKVERYILKRYSRLLQHKLNDEKILHGTGRSEVFILDVINSNPEYLKHLAKVALIQEKFS